MIVYFLLLMLLVVVGVRPRHGKGELCAQTASNPSRRAFFGVCPHEDGSEAWGRKQAFVVNGFFILEVFLCHANESMFGPLGYDMSGWGDQAWLSVFRSVFSGRQVVLFLFFSGYGVCEQLRLKGSDYLDGLPRKRILTTYLNYAVAVSIFVLVNLALQTKMRFMDAALAFTFVRSIGNSTWYIGCIILMYFFTFIAYKLFKGRFKILLTVTGLTMGYIAVTASFACCYWYDTALAYPFGVAVSLYKKEILVFLRQKAFFVGLLSIGLFCVLRPFAADYPALVNNGVGLLFCAVILIFLLYFEIKSSFLSWIGVHLFPIYIYQKLFFLIVAELWTGPRTPILAHLAFLVTLFATVLTARFYRSGIRIK